MLYEVITDLDKSTQQQLRRGSRMLELLKQGQYMPMVVEEQVASIFAGVKGYLDQIPGEEVSRFEAEYLDFLRTRHLV